jgi:hypothetical protein
MTIAKKSSRIRVAGRSQLAGGVAQRREYARNYARVRAAIDEVLEKHWGHDECPFSSSIMATVRDLIGCRITEISDSSIDDALACVTATHHLIHGFRWHLKCKDSQRKWEEREREDTACIGAMNRVLSSARSAMGANEGPSKAPALSLVHDCGRDLAQRDSSPSGPYSA